MSKIQKVCAALFAALMTAVVAVPAFAASGGYTVTINNSTQGHTYEAYQVFTGDLSGQGDNLVLSNVEWGDGVKGSELLEALKEHGDAFAACADAADVAQVLENYGNDSESMKAFADIVGQHLTATTSGSCDQGIPSDDSYTYTISGLAAGYYLVQDKAPEAGGAVDAYTRYMLQVVGNAEVNVKADVPRVEKKVQEDDKYNQDGGYGSGYNDVADYNIGDKVPFKLIGTLPGNLADYDTYRYVFHDTLSSGLTYDSDAKVYVVNDEVRIEVTDQFAIAGSGNALTISCNDVTALTGVDVGADSQIVVEYTATLNANAEVGLPGNPNAVYLEFSNNPNQGGEGDTGKTPEDKVIVFTYELDTTKVDGESTETKLADAEFVLYKVVDERNLYAQVDASGKVTGWAEAANAGGSITYPANAVLKSDAVGLFKVSGLDDGEYYLREIKAPDGYNLLEKDIEVIITATTANGQGWVSGAAGDALTNLEVIADAKPGTADTETGAASITVANDKGATLPETGGAGTVALYVVGGALVIGAGAALIVRKRRGGAR